MAIDNIYGMIRNKYLDNIGLDIKTYGTNWDIVTTPEMIESGYEWEEEQQECGGHDCRETFNFDMTFMEYLYTMLKFYVDCAGKIVDLEYRKFEYHNKKYTQLSAINEICDVLEEALTAHLKEPTPENPYCNINYDKVEEAIALFGNILPCLWW